MATISADHATLATRSMFGRRIAALGPPPNPDVRNASLSEMLKSSTTIELSQATTVEPYDATRLNVVKNNIQAKPLESFVSPDVG